MSELPLWLVLFINDDLADEKCVKIFLSNGHWFEIQSMIANEEDGFFQFSDRDGAVTVVRGDAVIGYSAS